VQQTMHTAASQMRVAGAAIKTYRAFRKDIAKPKLDAKAKEKEAKAKDKADAKDKAKAKDKAAAGGDTGGGAEATGAAADASANASDAAAGATATEASSLFGRRVRIEGLKGRADLNGGEGIAGSFDEAAGRYAVILDRDGECVKVKSANLVAIDKKAATGNGSGGGGGGAAAAGEDPSCGEGESSESAGGGPSEDTMYLMLESMWRVSMLDIESTLRHACNKVLSDQSADKAARRNRARGLVVMGRVFQSYGSPDALKTVDFAKHVESVGQKVQEEMVAEQERKRGAED